VCYSGLCSCGCPPAQVCCTSTSGVYCTNTLTDNNNCGPGTGVPPAGCGVKCTGGKTCVAGQCWCPTGQNDCNGICTVTQTDPNNCGLGAAGCGVKCATGQSCVAGQCV
jgi:hypothetical protein